MSEVRLGRRHRPRLDSTEPRVPYPRTAAFGEVSSSWKDIGAPAPGTRAGQKNGSSLIPISLFLAPCAEGAAVRLNK